MLPLYLTAVAVTYREKVKRSEGIKSLTCQVKNIVFAFFPLKTNVTNILLPVHISYRKKIPLKNYRWLTVREREHNSCHRLQDFPMNS